MANNYGDHHRLFLSIMMNKRLIYLPQLADMYKFCLDKFDVPHNATPNEIGDFIKQINNEIAHHHLKIKKGVSEENGAQFYALVNTADNELAKLSPEFSEVELEFIKIIIQRMLDSDTGTISSTVALNSVSELKSKKITRKQAEDVITHFEDKKFMLVKRGIISLSPLCIVEIEPYLRSVYEELEKCYMCSQICIQGQLCQGDCDVKLHHHCAERLFKNADTEQCPKCSEEWTRPNNIEMSQ